jgi:flavin reductase (DIM6/NTAB) family NADH-FMN oxidoreductase RutF
MGKVCEGDLMTVHPEWFEPETEDPRRLREALGRFATGVAVVATCTAEGRREGLTCNSFSAVSLEPPLVLWSLRKTAPSYPSFKQAGCFTVNVLAAGQQSISRHFSQPHIDKFADVDIVEGHRGCPLIAGALASFECETETILEGGDHSIFIGRVLRAAYSGGEPLIFSAGTYGTHSPLVDA